MCELIYLRVALLTFTLESVRRFWTNMSSRSVKPTQECYTVIRSRLVHTDAPQIYCEQTRGVWFTRLVHTFGSRVLFTRLDTRRCESPSPW